MGWNIGMLRQIDLYYVDCMVLCGIAWHCVGLHGIEWDCMVLCGIAWYCVDCMVLCGIAWYDNMKPHIDSVLFFS